MLDQCVKSGLNKRKEVMFKRYLLCLVILLITFVTSACTIGKIDSCHNVDIKWLQLHAPENTPMDGRKILSKKRIGDVCEVTVKRNNKNRILYTGDNFFILGNMFQEGKNVTKKKLSELKKEDFVKNLKNIDKATVIEYNPPKIKNTAKANNKAIYMFTDPLCPYCNKVGKEIKNISDQYGVPVKTLFYNVHDEEGKTKCIEAICRNFSLTDYIKDDWKKEESNVKYQCEAGEALYELSMKEARNIGVSGVPQFFLSDGTNIQGADIEALEEALQK